MFGFLHILHFLLIIQPLVFALQLFVYKNSNSKAARVLGVLMIAVSIFYFTTGGVFLVKIGLEWITSNFVYSFLLLTNPLFYLYVRALTVPHFKFNKKEALHLLPALVFLPLGVLGSNTELLRMETVRLVSTSLYNLQFVVYVVLMIVLLVRHSSNIKYYFSFTEGVNLNWLKIFVGFYIVTSALDILVFFMENTPAWQSFYYVLMVFFFNFLGFFGVYQPDIYDFNVDSGSDENDESEDEAIFESEETIKTGLPSEKKDALLADILTLMETEKPYLNSKLSIFELSRKLNVNKTYISRVINEERHENFSAFINRYRIEESKLFFQSNDYANYTIEGVAHSVGFNSKASFNTYFKKFTGMTPSQYKQSLRNEKS
jgi:AraC-like DNA-binding protein